MPREHSKRVSVQVSDGVSMSEALVLITYWYRKHEVEPDRYPMTGMISRNNLHCLYRDYRKSDCFLAWKDKEDTA